MNLNKVFEFIKEKRGYDYPHLYKLFNGLPLTNDELTFNYSLDLRNKNITTLPDNLTIIDGGLFLTYSKIKTLPNNLTVGKSLFLTNADITSLPDNLYVGRNLYIEGTKIDKIPNNLRIENEFWVIDTPLSKYNYEDIKKMIEDKGGYLGGLIIF